MKRFNDRLSYWMPLILLLLIFYSILCYLDCHRAVLPNFNL